MGDNPVTISKVPDGKLAAVVTYFEMTQKPEIFGNKTDLTLMAWDRPDLEEYRKLFRQVGDDWLWFGRLLLTDDELRSAIHDPNVKIFKAMYDGNTVGFVELDFSQPEQCEISYFGLIPEMNGKGRGSIMMAQTLERAWKDGIKRVWLHTCTNDSPRAPVFYERVGFTAYKREIEIATDPRLSGHLPMDAGRHVPIIPSAKNISNL
ncbi:GNAT family N-acetyltransferase [Parasphingorhabdus sp. JC815]|uniref:GNAT family N-acetyltransferase n=1 Tax=Parasphingorhabdus sp. JC815 TaxID=3232140 RepID=UPI0034594DD9